jgi:hypothetical protein
MKNPLPVPAGDLWQPIFAVAPKTPQVAGATKIPLTGQMRQAPDPVEQFIKRWHGHEGGAERANYGMYLTDI